MELEDLDSECHRLVRTLLRETSHHSMLLSFSLCSCPHRSWKGWCGDVHYLIARQFQAS